MTAPVAVLRTKTTDDGHRYTNSAEVFEHCAAVARAARLLRVKAEDIVRRRRPAKCEDCGKRTADWPHRLCPGCEAYREHQQ